MRIGASHSGRGVSDFCVWAPLLEHLDLKIIGPSERLIPMKKDDMGYWRVRVDDAPPGTRYFYRLNDSIDRPDPASHYQPEGVHGASEVVDHSEFEWRDAGWQGLPLEKMIIYELHIGAFTAIGTFKAVVPRLSELKELGVNTIEIMPVAQFPGRKNWGYDSVYLYAVQNSYGGPRGLKALIDACHRLGMAVLLDVVYNHLGPEGNYLGDFAPYFTEKYRTPWSQAVNYDDAYSYGVRDFVVQNAFHWFRDYHIDGLRLDAVHGIYDAGARHILEELADEVSRLRADGGRKRFLIAESDLNDTRIIKPVESGGYGIDAQWSDDFHHCLHTLLTGERGGYYADFGRLDQLAKAINKGFVYSWDFSPYRKRFHGSSSREIAKKQFIVCIQNHDQVGNRMLGERLAKLVSYEALKLAAGAMLLSPYVPLLFMGEEHAEDNPFLYFIDHTDPELVRAVREGRKREFASFAWKEEPPDPFTVETFERSRIDWSKRRFGKHRIMLDFYKELIRLRGETPVLSDLSGKGLRAWIPEEEKEVLFLTRGEAEGRIFCAMNFGDTDACLRGDGPAGKWRKLLDSAEEKWSGPGSEIPEIRGAGEEIRLRPKSFVLFKLENR